MFVQIEIIRRLLGILVVTIATWVVRFRCIGSLGTRRGWCLSSPWLLSDRPLWLPVCNSFFLKFSPRFDAIARRY